MHHKQQHKTAFAVLYEKRLQWIIATDVTINTFGFLQLLQLNMISVSSIWCSYIKYPLNRHTNTHRQATWRDSERHHTQRGDVLHVGPQQVERPLMSASHSLCSILSGPSTSDYLCLPPCPSLCSWLISFNPSVSFLLFLPLSAFSACS